MLVLRSIWKSININTNEVQLIIKRQGSCRNQNFGIERGQGIFLLVTLGHVVIQTLLSHLTA